MAPTKPLWDRILARISPKAAAKQQVRRAFGHVTFFETLVFSIVGLFPGQRSARAESTARQFRAAAELALKLYNNRVKNGKQGISPEEHETLSIYLQSNKIAPEYQVGFAQLSKESSHENVDLGATEIHFNDGQTTDEKAKQRPYVIGRGKDNQEMYIARRTNKGMLNNFLSLPPYATLLSELTQAEGDTDLRNAVVTHFTATDHHAYESQPYLESMEQSSDSLGLGDSFENSTQSTLISEQHDLEKTSPEHEQIDPPRQDSSQGTSERIQSKLLKKHNRTRDGKKEQAGTMHPSPTSSREAHAAEDKFSAEALAKKEKRLVDDLAKSNETKQLHDNDTEDEICSYGQEIFLHTAPPDTPGRKQQKFSDASLSYDC